MQNFWTNENAGKMVVETGNQWEDWEVCEGGAKAKFCDIVAGVMASYFGEYCFL